MEKEKVVEALRYCAQNEKNGCGVCRYRPFVHCKQRLFNDTIDLIEKLSNENARLKESLMGTPTPCDDCMTGWGNPYTRSCMDECERLKEYLEKQKEGQPCCP
jgi:hypothetical protein